MDVVQDTAQKLLVFQKSSPNQILTQPLANLINLQARHQHFIREPVNLVAHNLGMLDSTSGKKSTSEKRNNQTTGDVINDDYDSFGNDF